MGERPALGKEDHVIWIDPAVGQVISVSHIEDGIGMRSRRYGPFCAGRKKFK